MSSALDQRVLKLSLLSGPAVTLAVSPWFNYDPINLIKVLALSTLAFSIAGTLLGYRKLIIGRFTRKEWMVLLTFPACLLIPIFFADSNVSQQFWGVFGRNTGFLTYFSLWLLLIGVSSLRSFDTAEKIQLSLIWTAVPMTIYCLFQTFDLDPITWSSNNVFGTLGNINFLSAFFGLSSLVALIYATSRKISLPMRLAIILMVIVDMAMVYRTDSIQGLMIFAIGVAAYFGFLISKSNRFRSFRVLYAFSTLAVSILGAFGLLNKGPLRDYLYQVTNVYRADYMLAAIKMTEKFPLTGVGLDSYDNWYKRVRGFITTYRTAWNRTSNSAHNIFLDISSGGGLVLLAAYLAILIFAFRSGIKVLRQSTINDTWAISAFVLWLAYQAQSLISINQVGIGVWGWISSGLLIAMSKIEMNSQSNVSITPSSKKGERRKRSSRDINRHAVKPIAAVLSLVAGLIGFMLAFFPLSADAAFRNAANKRDLNLMIASTEKPGSNSLELARALEAAYANKYFDLATSLSERLTKNYPSETFGWQIRTGLSTLTSEQRLEAKKMVNLWDPYFACLESEPINQILSWYRALPAVKKWELLRFWGFTPTAEPNLALIPSIEASEEFKKKINTQCGGA